MMLMTLMLTLMQHLRLHLQRSEGTHPKHHHHHPSWNRKQMTLLLIRLGHGRGRHVETTLWPPHRLRHYLGDASRQVPHLHLRHREVGVRRIPRCPTRALRLQHVLVKAPRRGADPLSKTMRRGRKAALVCGEEARVLWRRCRRQ